MYRHVTQQIVTHEQICHTVNCHVCTGLYKQVMRQTVTCVKTCDTTTSHVCTDILYSKPSRVDRHMRQQPVTYVYSTDMWHSKPSRMHRHTIQQTVTYVQTCHSNNKTKQKTKQKTRHMRTGLSNSKRHMCSDLPHTRHFFFFSVLPSTSVWGMFFHKCPSIITVYLSLTHSRIFVR